MTPDPQRFLELCDDREAAGDPIELPDGSTVPRLPGLARWMWDGEFAGAIDLVAAGDDGLPPTCLGHIGYSVVPWKRQRGYATAALAAMLQIAAAEGLPIVDITTDLDNVAAQRRGPGQSGRPGRGIHEAGVRRGRSRLRFEVDLTAI